MQRPQKGENCIFSQNASANYIYLTVICFILWHTSSQMCSESCYIKLLLNLSRIRFTKRPWEARGWGISDTMSTGIVLYRQQYVLPKWKSLLKLKCTVGHVSCNWICIALHNVLVLVANPTSPTKTTEWSKDDSTMQYAEGGSKIIHHSFTRSFEIVHVVSISRHCVDLSLIMRLLTLDFVSMSLKLYQNARCRLSSDTA